MEYTIGFPRRSEFEKATKHLASMHISYEVLSPEPGYARVATPAIICGTEGLAALQDSRQEPITCSGWVEFRPSAISVPKSLPLAFEEDIFGEAAIMFLGPCMADEMRIRFIAHLSGDITAALPFLNAEMAQACFNHKAHVLTLMDGPRLVTLYERRIAVGKANDLVDGWRTLEWLRTLINDTWRRRGQLVPSSVMRSKPPVLEIYKRLPGTNCGACGERTCMAFAARLWRGEGSPIQCVPVFAAEYADRKAAFLEICAGLGLPSEEGLSSDAL